MLLTKNEKQKSLATSASISALLGITEPAIFVVNLKLKFPFICAMIASGVASAFIGLFHVLAVAMGPASVIGFISIAPKSIPYFMIGIVISVVVAFVTTYAYGKKNSHLLAGATSSATSESESVAVEINEDPEEAVETVQDDILEAPISGEVVQLKDVNDPVFSQEMMGKGIAISPTDGKVYAPADGELTVVYDTKHAYGMITDKKAEILIHIGIDTVQLNGEGFTTERTSGDIVKKGDLLGTVDLEVLKEKGYDTTTMMIVTNTNAFSDVGALDKKEVTAKEDILVVTQPE